MTNILFDRNTLKVVGLNRPALPFEVEVKNVDVSNFSKSYSYTEAEPKVTSVLLDNGETEDKELFYLPQDPTITEVLKDVQVETTTVTTLPVMITVLEQEPILNEDGTQKEYEVTTLGETTTVTDEPVMITVENTDGTTSEVQKKDVNGNLLYWGQVGTGQFNKCWTVVEKEVQKTDDLNQPLYWETQQVTEEEITENSPLEITKDDAQWTEQLEKVLVDVAKTRTVTFNEEQELFTYDDVVSYKGVKLADEILFTDAKLVERMDVPNLFSTTLPTFKADIGFDFISLPVGGEVRTEKITLPKSASVVGIVVESHIPGVEIKVGNLDTDLQLVNTIGERYFDIAVTDVYVNFKNTTDKRIDIHSFAILV